jgi:hypothetical protein
VPVLGQKLLRTLHHLGFVDGTGVSRQLKLVESPGCLLLEFLGRREAVGELPSGALPNFGKELLLARLMNTFMA